MHEVSSTLVYYSPLPFPANVLNAIVPDPDLPSSPDDAQPFSTSHNDDGIPLSASNADGPDNTVTLSPSQAIEAASSRPTLRADRKLTSGGHSYAESIQVAKVHLEKLRASKERWRQMREADERRAGMVTTVGTAGAVEEVDEEVDETNEHFVALCRKGLMEDPPDSFEASDNFAIATVSLDIHDYLQRDAVALFESTFLSLRSDIACNPRSPGYDMTTPPANHREAMMRSDVDEWKKVEEKELEMLRSMGVYVDEELPEGRKAIGNRWVFKFKLDVDGGPPIHKARLVAQGFSQVPFVDYDATFAPVAKSASVRS